VWLLLALYIAITMGFVGFGMMVAGPMGARRVARVFFLQPLWFLWSATRRRLRQLLAFGWSLLVTFVFAPILSGLRWLGTRERGWLRR
jgi:hypothetical protein